MAGSKANTWETGLMLLLFNNTDFGGVGDAGGLRGSVASGSLFLSLHTSTPDEGGGQNTNEATYTGYLRIGVARTSGGWTCSSGSAQNTAENSFPQCTGGSNTITHFGVGTTDTGAGKLLYYGSLNQSLAVSTGITPKFPAGALVVSED